MNSKDEINMNSEFFLKLKEILSKNDTPPFLFVGSGISIRYCEIPTWLGILKGFVNKNRGCFKHNFGFYSSKCNNDPKKIASDLAREFHEYWWKSEEYEDSRKNFENLASLNIENAFKIELSKYVNSCKKDKPSLSNEIKNFKKSVISGILTTNWDILLEELFPEFQVKIGQKEAIFSDYKTVGELYKIHGCTSSPGSIIVTTNDYEKFISDNYYLNAKLLTLFADYPILFVGYSMSDPNIEMIFKNLISCLDQELLHVEKLQNRLIFVEWQTSPCIPKIEYSTYNSNSITIPITKIKVHEYNEIWEALSSIPRKLSIKTIRQLQKMVYEFVTTSKPEGKILVNGIENLDNVENLEVVVGFGNISKLQSKGLVGLKVSDLLKDILFDDINKEDHEEIVKNVLKDTIRKNVYVPFFKYNKSINNLNDDNSLRKYHYDNYVLTRSNKISIEDYRNARNFKLIDEVKNFNSLEEVIEIFEDKHVLQRIMYLEKNKIDIQELRNYLKKLWPKFMETKNSYSSNYRKCICLLDYLENANH